MIRRPRRTLPALLVALGLLAAAVLTAISCIQLLLGQPPLLPFAELARTASGLSWHQPVVLAGAAVITLLGLMLLAAALVPGTPTVLPLAPVADQPEAGVTRPSLSRSLANAAAAVDGIDHAQVRVRDWRVTATVRTPLGSPGLDEQVRSALAERLDDIAPARHPRIRVRLSAARSS